MFFSYVTKFLLIIFIFWCAYINKNFVIKITDKKIYRQEPSFSSFIWDFYNVLVYAIKNSR